MATNNAKNLDRWIRSNFKDLNTQLEERYSTLDHIDDISKVGGKLKSELIKRGGELISNLLLEGNTDEGFDSGFDLLGNVGLYMAACRRHEVNQISNSKVNQELNRHLRNASALALQLGASLGVVPRFASAHLETHNRAINGKYKTFTHLEAEELFLEYNTRGVFCFIRASEALLNCLPLGVSHPVAYDLLSAAKQALDEVLTNNQQLFQDLDTDHFFYHIRPYYKTHDVGLREYRGANAGDFAGINAIDLLLGLCRADDAYYSQLLVDKFLFMRPEDQTILRDCMRRQSLMDEFLESINGDEKNNVWFQKNLKLFLNVCEAHGKTAQQHHNMLIKKFIEQPADSAQLNDQKDITASGPPLHLMLRGLKKLCDLRSAALTDDVTTRYHDIELLKRNINPTLAQ